MWFHFPWDEELYNNNNNNNNRLNAKPNQSNNDLPIPIALVYIIQVDTMPV